MIQNIAEKIKNFPGGAWTPSPRGFATQFYFPQINK